MKLITTTILTILAIAGNAQKNLTPGKNSFETKWIKNQTYQYDRMQVPKYREAILITKEVNDRVFLSEEDREVATTVRQQWEEQLRNKLKPFIKMITGTKNR